MKFHLCIMTVSLIVTLFFSACGSSTDGAVGGTETGTTTPGIDTTTVGERIDATSSAVLLSVNASAVAASESSAFLIDGTADDWNVYLSEGNSYVITDIFGNPDETPQFEKKNRGLLDQFSGKVEEIFLLDESVDCTGTTPLDDSDTLEVAFYGELDNGPADDRYFDCVSVDETDNVTFVYGIDADNIIRLVEMKEITMANTEETETRGDEVTHHSVVRAVYAEQTEEDATSATIDVQYAQATLYNGLDDSFDTTDDMMFKSRSRITGLATLDESGTASDGVGDFTVTKYDRSLTPEDVPYEIITQTMGRGDYSDGGASLFKIDSDVDAVVDLDGTFCIQSSATDLPSVVDAANCTDLETTFAWGDVTFPFDLSPAISATFDDNAFFAGDNDDLIDEDGSDFIIPIY
jgi:hypothetical protein